MLRQSLWSVLKKSEDGDSNHDGSLDDLILKREALRDHPKAANEGHLKTGQR
jgi:hypothetical protein